VSSSEDALGLFLNGFSARDLAEPLPSFDDTTPTTTIRAAMKAQQLDVVGVRRSGVVIGWLTRDDAASGRQSVGVRPFDPASVISDSASLNEVMRDLNAFPCLFVRGFGQVSGLIRRVDLQKPAMRMWLFGLVTITELRVTRLIDELCPHESWQKYLSAGRLQKSREFLQERLRRGQSRTLLDCLQFADKGQIVARDESLRVRTRFASRREVEEFVKALQDLRNNLAHSQDISGDWDVIHDLATNLHRIVLGTSPESISEPP
jgi:hypothetical protein